MNEQTTVAKMGDNSEKTFKEFNAKLDAIDRSVREAHRKLKAHDAALFAALGEALDLGQSIADKRVSEGDEDWSFLKSLLEHHRRRWSPKCERNFFHELVSIGFDKLDDDQKPITSEPNLSKYRMLLRFAYEQGWDGEVLIAQLAEHSLTKIYEQAVQEARRDPLDRFVENDQDRFERASRELLGQTDLPSGVWTQRVTKPQTGIEFVPAMLHVTDAGFQVVGLYADEAAVDVRSKVSELVPAEAKRSSAKLAEQDFYWLFVTCDFYTRFLPGLQEARQWETAERTEDVPSIGMNPTDAEVTAYLLALKKKSEERTSIAQTATSRTADKASKKFVLLNALVCRHDGSAWTIEAQSTLAHAPVIKVVIDETVQSLATGQTHWIKSSNARGFVDDFPRFEGWEIKKDRETTSVAAKSADARKVLLADYSALGNWRSLDESLTSVGRFSLSQSHLSALGSWKPEFRSQKRFGRHEFQSRLRLDFDGDDLTVCFPNNSDQKRLIGQLQSAAAPTISEDRFVEFAFIEKLIGWSEDYGTSFEFDLLSGHQGLTALRFDVVGHKLEISLTVPLLLSHKGAPTEINVPGMKLPATLAQTEAMDETQQAANSASA